MNGMTFAELVKKITLHHTVGGGWYCEDPDRVTVNNTGQCYDLLGRTTDNRGFRTFLTARTRGVTPKSP